MTEFILSIQAMDILPKNFATKLFINSQLNANAYTTNPFTNPFFSPNIKNNKINILQRT